MPAPWRVKFRAEAQKDLGALDNSQQAEVLKALKKVSLNPLPQSEGGYGKPLRGGLAGLMKIKLKAAGLPVDPDRDHHGDHCHCNTGWRCGLRCRRETAEMMNMKNPAPGDVPGPDFAV